VGILKYKYNYNKHMLCIKCNINKIVVKNLCNPCCHKKWRKENYSKVKKRSEKYEKTKRNS